MSVVIDRYIPPDSTATEYPDVSAVVYLSPAVGTLGPRARGYHGKSSKADFNYSFRNEATRQSYIDNWLDGLRQAKARRDQRHAEQAGFVHGFKVGDVLTYSWGYDQTNAEFYQVTEVKAKTVVIREIAHRSAGSEGFMCNRVVAIPDHFKGEPMTKRPVNAAGWGTSHPEGVIRMDFGSAVKWDGSPEYNSWYA